MDVTGIWEGTLDGTNWGRLLMKLDERAGAISGIVQISDIGVGTYTLDVTGTRDEQKVSLHLSPGSHNVQNYQKTIDAQITSESAQLIRGDWRSSIGTF